MVITNYKKIRDNLIKKYSTKYVIYTDCQDDNSWCNLWRQEINFREEEYDDPSNLTIFILLHEIGHLETNTLFMPQCEKEFLATQWAIKEMKKLKFVPPVWVQKEYQKDIWNKCNKDFPKDRKKRKELTLVW